MNKIYNRNVQHLYKKKKDADFKSRILLLLSGICSSNMPLNSYVLDINEQQLIFAMNDTYCTMFSKF